MKVTITIEDDPITGDVSMRTDFDPPIDVHDMSPGDMPPSIRLTGVLYGAAKRAFNVKELRVNADDQDA